MKRLIIVLCCFFPLAVLGQINWGCSPSGTNWVSAPFLVDSTDFSGNTNGYINYSIDPMPNNLWQIGSVSKVGFPATVYGSQAIQTDTTNVYSANNTSIFYVWDDSTYSPLASKDSLVSIDFWHYYDVDLIGDSCLVQLSIDSGNTWLNYDDITIADIDYGYNVPNALDPDNSGKFLWMGQSNGWQKVRICFLYNGVKPNRSVPWPVAFRFLFKSDNIHTNKPGWVIDKIRISAPGHSVGLNEYIKDKINIYPNPSQDGIFHIDFPSSYITGQFFVYDYLGRVVEELSLKEKLDLSHLKRGLYFYRAVFNQTNQWFSGKLEIK